MKFKTKFAACLLSLLLLMVEAGALAHELEHQIQKPDAPCAHCLFANHIGKTPVAIPYVFSLCAPETYSLPSSVPAPRRQEFHAYAVRAPPVDSEI